MLRFRALWFVVSAGSAKVDRGKLISQWSTMKRYWKKMCRYRFDAEKG